MKHFISPQKARQMIALYKKEKKNMVHTPSGGKDNLMTCETFERAAIDVLLKKPGCTGLRVYFGMNPDLKVHAIIVGVDSDNKDILPPINTADSSLSPENSPSTNSTDDTDETTDGHIVEDGVGCPPICPVPSYINP